MDCKDTLIQLFIEHREYFSWCYTHDMEEISEEVFNKIFDEYWNDKKFSDQEIVELWRVLKQINSEAADIGLASALFRIELQKAVELKQLL